MAKSKRKPSKYNNCMSRELKGQKGSTSASIKNRFKKAAAICSKKNKSKD